MALHDKLRLLVVDDMSTSRGLISQALENFGIRNVITAASGTEALDLVIKYPVHLILSDFNMPKMDGLALLAAIRANPKTQTMGFIMVSGRADETMLEIGRSLGMNNYLQKPFTPASLRDCLEAVVGRL